MASACMYGEEANVVSVQITNVWNVDETKIDMEVEIQNRGNYCIGFCDMYSMQGIFLFSLLLEKGDGKCVRIHRKNGFVFNHRATHIDTGEEVRRFMTVSPKLWDMPTGMKLSEVKSVTVHYILPEGRAWNNEGILCRKILAKTQKWKMSQPCENKVPDDRVCNEELAFLLRSIANALPECDRYRASMDALQDFTRYISYLIGRQFVIFQSTKESIYFKYIKERIGEYDERRYHNNREMGEIMPILKMLISRMEG